MAPQIHLRPSRRLSAMFASFLLGAACVLTLGSCTKEEEKPPAATTAVATDPYDVSKMDFKTPPATVSETRHTGPYATGSALSLDSTLRPLVADQVKTIQLDTVHRVIEIAPGVKFSAWTFGGQVPGPAIRARVGDRIKFSMTNRSDEVMPGMSVTPAPMMHSMDFHAAMVSPQDKYRSIAPGQTIQFEFTVNYPGVFMYHCGTPMVLEHIAAGMYGMIVVEPRGGYPTKADREYIVVQSEFYTKSDAANTLDGQPLYVLDGEHLRAKQPTYTVFNGRYNGMVEKPLVAKPGERVRLFVLNAGPSNTSSFHVVGAIFDRAWLDGNPDNQLRGMQTVLLGSSGSAIVEFIVPEAGSYVMVDHHFANASQGAIGIVAAGTPTAPGATAPEHHNIPATPTPTDPDAVKAKLSFESKCLACHSIGGGDKVGPDLLGVTRHRTDAWLTKWLKSPEVMLQTDPDAKAMLAKYRLPMPNQNLSDTEVRQLIKYFHWADDNLTPAAPTGQMMH